MSFVSELKRRKVFQVAAVYLVVAWIIMQVVDVVNEPLRLPEWFATVAILLVAIGFPIALILSWAFDLTPDGVVKDQGTVTSSGRRIEYVFIGLLIVAVGWLSYREVGPTSPAASGDVLPNSVAVLPFTNLSPDPDDEYFAAGIHDELLTQLTKISDLTVIARTSVLSYPGSGKSIEEIAEELNVETVMEGSVRYAGDLVRITAQLIDPATGGHLWAETYEREFSVETMFAIESDIAANIAMALEAELLPSELASIENSPTVSTEAYDLYLRARSLPEVSIYPETLPTHLGYLDQAISLDPSFALAYAEKAMRLVRSSDIERFAIAQENAEHALALDPDVGLAHLAIAHIERKLLNESAAREAYERAFQLSPREPEVLIEYSRFLAYVGEYSRAIELARQAIQIDPNSTGLHTRFAIILGLAGDLDSAEVASQAAIRADPGHGNAYLWLALTEIARGNDGVALENVIRADQLWSAPTVWGHAEMAYTYGRLGRSTDAARHADQFEILTADIPGDVGNEAVASLAVGDSEKALELLNEHVQTTLRATDAFDLASLIYIKVNVWNDPILEQPEFVEVRSRLGFME